MKVFKFDNRPEIPKSKPWRKTKGWNPKNFPFFFFKSLLYFTVQYQMEMMRNLRHVNIDHLHVGWYQSTLFGSFISRAFVDSQFNYQHSIEESVVLIYGKAVTFNIFVIKKKAFSDLTNAWIKVALGVCFALKSWKEYLLFSHI